MKQLIILATLVTIAFSRTYHKEKSSKPGEIRIFVFVDGADDKQMDKHIEEVTAELKEDIRYRIDIGNFHAYTQLATDEAVIALKEDVDIKYIEDNLKVTTQVDCTDQVDLNAGLWGLERTTMKVYNPQNIYTYDNDAAGQGIFVYVVDTGIKPDHDDFTNRLVRGREKDTVDNDNDATDQNGHGTHVAGTILGTTHGIAKKAKGVGVRVLDAQGSGTIEGVIRGLDHVEDTTGEKEISVVNLSLGGDKCQALNDVVDALVDKGIHVAVAAGNSHADATNYSPASAEKCVTVAAINNQDTFAVAFSNFGGDVDILAPGVGVLSAWIEDPFTEVLEGTSMAAPHVSGVMAKMLSKEARSPANLKAALLAAATTGQANAVPAATTDKIVFMDCEKPKKKEKADDEPIIEKGE